MKKHDTASTFPASRSRALIAVPRPAPRRGMLGTCARVAITVLALPLLAVLALARGVALIGKGLGRGLGRGTVAVVTGLARLVAAPFVLGARLAAGIARLLGAAIGGLARGGRWLSIGAGKGIMALLLLPVKAVVLLARGIGFVLRIPLVALRLLGRGLVGVARGLAWLGARAGRGIVAILLLPVRILALLARLVVVLARLLARGLVLALKLPFVSLRLLGRGGLRAASGLAFLGAAITVPAAALAWGVVRYLAAGISATVRGVAKALAFSGRLVGRGIALVGRGTFATVASIAIGIFACVRGTVRLALRIAFLLFLATRIVAVGLARGVRNGAALFADAASTVGAGLVEVVRAAIALVRLAGRGISLAARSVGAALSTREPQHAALLPLGTLAALGIAEIMGLGGFPFATLGLLVVGAFACLALLSRPVNIVAVLLAWGLAVTAGWRAERISLDTPVWFDALVYLSALAALRSAYVAARAFLRESPATQRDAEQERAHRRASRAIGMVLAAQCVVFTFWSAADGGFAGAPLFGELLLVGAGIALAWVVRTGQYVRAAQAMLTLGAIATLVLTVAAQFSAFGAGQLVTAASLGSALLLLLVAAALIVVVHTRMVDTDRGG